MEKRKKFTLEQKHRAARAVICREGGNFEFFISI